MRRTADGPPRDRREGRRPRARQLHEQGWSGRRIAEALGVTGRAVSQWLKRAREGGREALRLHPPPDPLPTLTEPSGRRCRPYSRREPRRTLSSATFGPRGAKQWLTPNVNRDRTTPVPPRDPHPPAEHHRRSLPKTAGRSHISKSAIRTGRSFSIIMVDPVAGLRHASSQMQQRSIGYASSASTDPAWDSPVPKKHAPTPAGLTT